MLVNQIFDGAAWVDANNRLVNIVGTPIASVALNSDGQQLSDEYTLTFDTVVAGVSANATIVSLSPNNPYRATKAVLLDGATVHKNVIPGYDIVFSNAGGFLATWSSTIKAGQFGGTFDASGIGAGVPSAGVRQRAYNAGTGADSGCLAGLRTMIKEYKKVGSVFSKTENFAFNAVEKTAGGGSSRVMPYVLTITNTAGTGGDTANIMVFPSRYRRVGPDAGGVQGAMGAADIVLTQAGQAAGTILAGGFAFYWADFLVPAGANPESNPYPTDVYVAGTVTGAAGWAT
jgi:hypothetical protein